MVVCVVVVSPHSFCWKWFAADTFDKKYTDFHTSCYDSTLKFVKKIKSALDWEVNISLLDQQFFNSFVHCLKFTRDAWKLIEKMQICTGSTTLLIEYKGTADFIHRTANEVSRNGSHQELFQIWEYAFPTEAGLSMSSLFRPNYANLFMGKFELVHVYNNNNNPYFSFSKCWFRYLDDLVLYSLGL